MGIHSASYRCHKGMVKKYIKAVSRVSRQKEYPINHAIYLMYEALMQNSVSYKGIEDWELTLH